jgi:RimJ/RimL family protein N-acetyltransferase
MRVLVDFEPKHLQQIRRDPDDADPTLDALFSNLDARAERYATRGPAATILAEDNTVLAVGGIIELYPGSGEAWLLLSAEGRKRSPLSIVRNVAGFLDRNLETRFRRIQALVAFDNRQAHRLIMRLGFVPEGAMPYYGPNGEHFIRYVRFSL